MKGLLNSIEQVLARMWQRVLAASIVDLSSLIVLRLVIGPFMLLLSAPHFGWVGRAPEGLFEPPFLSIAVLFDDFPAAWIFDVWDIVLVLLVVCICVGLKARWACLLLVAGNLLLASFAYSFGKIDHDIIYKLFPACLAFTNWGTEVAFLPDKKVKSRTQSAALGIFAVLIAFGMLTAGVEKAYVWVDFDPSSSGFFSWFNSGYFNLGRQYLAAPLILSLPPQLFELADYGAVAFETSGFLFLLLGRQWWRLWLIVACLFHLLNTLLLNIGFIEHSLVYGVFLIPLVFDAKPFTDNKTLPRVCGGLAILFAIVHLIQRLGGEGSEYLFMTDPQIARMANLYSSLLVWGAMVPIVAFSWLKNRDSTASDRAPEEP